MSILGELQSAKQKGVTVLAQRKPLLFVFVGVLLLRLATRTFYAEVLHEPPRKTREPRLETSWVSSASTTESNTLSTFVGVGLVPTRRNTISGNHKGCPYYDVLGFIIFLCVYEVMLDFRGLETPTSLF